MWVVRTKIIQDNPVYPGYLFVYPGKPEVESDDYNPFLK